MATQITQLEKDTALRHAQQAHDETMRVLRLEFAQHWNSIWKLIGSDKRALMALAHHAAWLGFIAGKGIKAP